ncbi:major facilitator superfamily transporter [Xylariomycetidae sp. FL2044]|nr:major facilitator superfamily transporter [Xylariomycetidae sp. FL2044]
MSELDPIDVPSPGVGSPTAQKSPPGPLTSKFNPDYVKSLPSLPPSPLSPASQAMMPNLSANSAMPSPTSMSISSPGLQIPQKTVAPPKPSVYDGVAALVKVSIPPIPISKDADATPRPFTASTKRLSFSSMGSKPAVKYGMARGGRVELSPQPSDDPEDPLNWPAWRKHLNFVSLLSMVGLVGAMKTAFISVNSPVAVEEGVSYTAAVGLTAAPLMVSALTGLISTTVAKIWGKRPVYLVSAVLMFIGVLWNIFIGADLAPHMAARIFQGLGWGAFDSLVLGSIHDTYFEHERQLKITIYHSVSAAATWGSPLLGGVASSGSMGFSTQFEVMTALLGLSLLALILGAAPETTYHRSPYADADGTTTSPGALERSQSFWPSPSTTRRRDAARAYLRKAARPYSYRAPVAVDTRLLAQVVRAAAAPTSLLLVALTALPYAALWSFASTLSLYFAPMPFMLSATKLGALMTGPFLFATAVAAGLALPFAQSRFTPVLRMATMAAGTLVAVVGTFGYGMYMEGGMDITPSSSSSSSASEVVTGSRWDIAFMGQRISLPLISFLLGLVAAGSLALDASIPAAVQRSAAFTSPNSLVAGRRAVDMHAGVACLRNLVAGALILGLPNAAWAFEGLRAAALGLGAAQIVVAGAVGVVFWFWDESVRRMDGKVMGMVDLGMLKEQGSFFDMS